MFDWVLNVPSYGFFDFVVYWIQSKPLGVVLLHVVIQCTVGIA